jgi:23S rRNA (cytidine1920-2'-O)/16S rRNA (cytidine1409-2'-O)-methyltransferase
MKIRLDELLVSRGLAETRSAAQRLVMEGKVRVKNIPHPKSGNKYPDDIEVELLSGNRFVSRGGEKLEGAFRAFDLDVTGLKCLDIGASTGGFTDCLLQYGAKHVVALDVGTNQLHHKMRADPRVTVMEKFNARTLTIDDLPYAPEFAVCDVSFISLRLILPPLLEVLVPGAGIITLIKPQFEAGKSQVGKGGVVRDETVRQEVVQSIKDFGETIGFQWKGVAESPITGPKGNVEYTAWWTKKHPDL